MLGLGAQRPEMEEEARHTESPASFLGLVDYAPVRPTSPDLDAELAEGRRVPVLLGQPLSPRPLSPWDRRFQIALVISVVFHLSLILLLPAASRKLAALQAARLEEQEKIEPFYMFPYLPHDKPEPPANARPPLSDLSRRAHGGEGQPDVTPGSHGNTPEPRLEARRREVAAKEGSAAVPPAQGSQQTQTADATPLQGLGENGADAVLRLPKRTSEPASGALKGLSAFGAPGGDAGAAPERRGGQVDLGPLSFETQWYDWGAYAAEMLRRIRYHWVIPEIAQLGVPGVVRIHFYIERSGRVTGLEIDWRSEHPPMDFAARDAIQDASPLPPLPADLTGVDREGVTITFYYNTKPPEGTQSG